MFSWVGNFYRRHKRKLFITGLVLGGTYAAGKYLQYRVEKYFEKKYLDQATQARKDYHFRSNQKTCSMTFISFLPNIRNVIAEQLNTEELLEVLRLGPANKLELWEQLKLLSFARCITCIIINVVVYVFLKVQMNIMGGYMFIDGSTDDSEEDTGTSTKGERIAFREIQEEYLNTVKYILDHGLSDLIDDVSRAVKEVIGSKALSEKLSHSDIKDVCSEILAVLSSASEFSEETQHPLCKYMQSDVGLILSDADQNCLYQQVVQETREVLQSADSSTVIEHCLVGALDRLYGDLRPHFQSKEEDPEAIVSGDPSKMHYKETSLPLAKIIPLMNGQLHKIFSADHNEYLDAIMSQRSLQQFAENIYEAFSDPDNCSPTTS